MTNEQINIALAKWHSEHDEKYEYSWSFGTLFCDKRKGAASRTFLGQYTNSFDTLRMIEDMLCVGTFFSYGCELIKFAESIGEFSFRLTAEQRCRVLVEVLGLEVSDED